MVFRKISKDLKERAIWLQANGWLTDDICEILNISESSLKRWRRNMDDYEDVIPPRNPMQGRPRTLDAMQVADLMNLLDDNPELYLDEVQDWIAISCDVGLSRSAIHYIIRDLGYTYKMLKKAASERDEELRAEWKARVLREFVAEQMVFVDETSKDDRTLFRRWGRAVEGERAEISANFIRGTRYSVVAALSLSGYVTSRVVEGSVDGLEFLDFMIEEVIPQMNRYPQDRSVLIMDNCAIHKSDAVREALEAQGCILRFLPPYSPDFNPIEESFSTLKQWIRRNGVRLLNSEDPHFDLLEACGTITAKSARGWFGHAGYL